MEQVIKNKIPLHIKIVAALITMLIVAAMLLMTNALFGNPFSAAIAKSKIQKYVDAKYSAYHLTLSNAKYNLVISGYYVVAKSDKNENFSFNIEYSKGKIYDEFESSSLSYWGREYKKILEPVLKEKFDDSFKKCTIAYDKNISYNPLNTTKFDKDWPAEKTAFMNFKLEDISYYSISDLVNEVHAFLLESGYKIENYSYTFEYNNGMNSMTVNNINEKDINENLEDKLTFAEANDNTQGIKIFKK